jgi:hypothetical protein
MDNTGRLNPKLWEKAEKIAFEKFNNKHSARMRQYQGKVYRDLGGKYTDDLKPNQQSLKDWTDANWTTKSGLPSGITGERYLPKAVIEQLTDKEYEKTSKAKKKGTEEGKQYVKQPKEIVKKIKGKVIDGYKYFISNKPNKKLMVKVNDKWIHFGAYPNYQHFYDETELLDDKYNHYDIDRRYKYLTRASKIKNKKGELTAYNPDSANYHAMRILWEF